MAAHIECMKSELDLFSPLPIQSSVLRCEEVAFSPIASLDNASSIEFVSLGNGETYRDISNIHLRMVLQINGKNDPKPADPKVGVANNILHSLIRNCIVSLNNMPVSQSDNNYHYRAYIETLLNYGSDASQTHLESSGWFLDSGKVNSITDKENPGLDKRKELLQKI